VGESRGGRKSTGNQPPNSQPTRKKTRPPKRKGVITLEGRNERGGSGGAHGIAGLEKILIGGKTGLYWTNPIGSVDY